MTNQYTFILSDIACNLDNIEDMASMDLVSAIEEANNQICLDILIQCSTNDYNWLMSSI